MHLRSSYRIEKPKILKDATYTPLSLLESLRLDVLEGLTSPRELYIGYCEKLASLSEGIQYLTSLERLFIWRFPLLNHLAESMQSLNALWWLEIRDCINLMCLPDSVRRLGSLKLHILGCPRCQKREVRIGLR